MRKMLIIALSIILPNTLLAQGGYAYPGNYAFKSFMDGQKAYNYSGLDFLLGRNVSPKTDRNFTFLKNSITNWSYVRLSKNLRHPSPNAAPNPAGPPRQA